MRRGDLFVTGSKTPYELRWNSPLGAELEVGHIHLAVDQLTATLETVYQEKAAAVEDREAGYTVACWSLGFRVRRATITLPGKPSEFLSWLRAARYSRYSGLSRRSMMRYHDRIVCALVGLEAQRRVARESVRSSDRNNDEAMASELLLRLHGEERERICAFRYLKARARNLVSNQLPLIEDLAKGLLKYQSLTGREIAGILQANRLAQMQEGSSP